MANYRRSRSRYRSRRSNRSRNRRKRASKFYRVARGGIRL